MLEIRELLRKLRLAAYWGLPPLILYLVFQQLDLERLIEIAARANLWLIGLGGSAVFVKIYAGAMRWHRLAQAYSCTHFTAGESFRAYWLSLALGVFTPGSLGSDVYRVALGGRQTGRYLRGAFVVAVEKITALLSCVMLVSVTFPFLTVTHWSPELDSAMLLAYVALALGIGLLVALRLGPRSRWLSNLAVAFWRKISRLANKALDALPAPSVQADPGSVDPAGLLQLLFSLRVAVPLIMLSAAIHVVGAIQGQIFLQALGYDLPFLVNLFIAPLNVLVLTLPITVGGFGVREGVFVLFYGAFGVPPEIALLVSFCSLGSVLIAHAVGGLMFFAQRTDHGSGSAAHARHQKRQC